VFLRIHPDPPKIPDSRGVVVRCKIAPSNGYATFILATAKSLMSLRQFRGLDCIEDATKKRLGLYFVEEPGARC
jgi:hypothetical protein